jgi:hypothetical protein
VAFLPGGLVRRLIQLPSPVFGFASGRNCGDPIWRGRCFGRAVMRSPRLLSDVHQAPQKPTRPDTYEHVRRALDEALAELQLPVIDKEESGPIKIQPAN